MNEIFRFDLTIFVDDEKNVRPPINAVVQNYAKRLKYSTDIQDTERPCVVQYV
jgi:hypothetical protein